MLLIMFSYEKIRHFHFPKFLTWCEVWTYTRDTPWQMKLVGDIINLITWICLEMVSGSVNYLLIVWTNWWQHIWSPFFNYAITIICIYSIAKYWKGAVDHIAGLAKVATQIKIGIYWSFLLKCRRHGWYFAAKV